MTYAYREHSFPSGRSVTYVSFVADACQFSPQHLPEVITVAASDNNDTVWAWSNYGSCVDVFAPGVAILSAMDTSDNATFSATGTTMAAAHAAGVVALYLQSNVTASPSQVRTSDIMMVIAVKIAVVNIHDYVTYFCVVPAHATVRPSKIATINNSLTILRACMKSEQRSCALNHFCKDACNKLDRQACWLDIFDLQIIKLNDVNFACSVPA